VEIRAADLALVRRAAVRRARSVPRCVTVDELECAGRDGLLHALSRYDPSRGVRWQAYLSQRVAWAQREWL
jgi:DNA-directed RNA polymerase specialized sigma subunit